MDKIASVNKLIQIYVDYKDNKRHVYTYQNIVVAGEENKGWQRRGINVIFDKELDSSEIDQDGMLLLDTSIVRIPKFWNYSDKSYPYIYIKEYIKYYRGEGRE